MGPFQVTLAALVCLASLSPISGRILKPPGLPIIHVPDEAHQRLAVQALPPYNTTYYFNQLIDHNNPSKGTFQQRYWHTAEYYKPGGPIILMNAGEVNAAPYYGYVTNGSINGVIAQKYGGSAIVLEHRFFGLSNPYPNLDVSSLQLLTIAQTIEDHVYFAQNVVLPQTNGDQLTPDRVPWILFGGSYPGALVPWTMLAHPNVFWIGYASSAVVQAQLDFWQYYLPILQNMPQNCSADVTAAIAYIDSVLMGTNTTALQNLKSNFGSSIVTNLQLADALRWDLWTWQSQQPNTGPGGAFYQFCDALEVKNGVQASATGWGVTNAVSAWAKHFVATYGAPASIPEPKPENSLVPRADYPVDDPTRSWQWLVCNELGFGSDGPPVGQTALVSRVVTWQTEMQVCVSTFPDAFTTYPTPNTTAFNQLHQGWNVKLNRLFFANGKRDPWREATVSATNSTAVSTDNQPIMLSNGFHASDLIVKIAAADPTVQNVQNQFVQYAGTWLSQFVPNVTSATTTTVGSTTTAPTTTAPTTTANSTTAAPTTTAAGTVAHWGQCGGNAWTGGTVCVSPYTCQIQNDWYSQCL